jgi:hypothetical protein
VFRPNQLEAVLEAVTVAGSTTLSIAAEHPTAIELLHSSTAAAPGVIRWLIVKAAPVSKETGHKPAIVRAMVHRAGSNRVPAIAPAAEQAAAIVSGVEVHPRVPVIVLAAEQVAELEIEAHHRVFHRVLPREAEGGAAAEALVEDPAV